MYTHVYGEQDVSVFSVRLVLVNVFLSGLLG